VGFGTTNAETLGSITKELVRWLVGKSVSQLNKVQPGIPCHQSFVTWEFMIEIHQKSSKNLILHLINIME